MKHPFLNKLSSFQHTITGGAIVIGAASLASRLIGLVRDNLFARKFGAGATLDIYNAAFKIPDFLFNVIILGALFASFIPVFLEYWNKDKDEAWRIVHSVLTILLSAFIVLALCAAIFAHPLTRLLVGGWDIEKQNKVADLMRIMLISTALFAISNVLSGILNAFRRFSAYAFAPLLYNVGIIIGILWLSDIYGIHGLAYGVVLGALLHVIVQIPSVYRTGFRAKILYDIHHPGVRKIFRLMIPRSLALAVTQINFLLITVIASTLPERTMTIWSWADNLQHFPINIFGVSLALSSFPVVSQAFIEKDNEKFKITFSESFRRIMFFIIPVSIAILLLRAQIVRLVLGMGAGNFDWQDTIDTAETLGFFSLSLFAQASIPLLARTFFAQQDTKTPVVVSIISVIINILAALLLAPSMGVYGLALAFSMAAILNMLLLLGTLRSRLGDIDDDKIIASTLRIVSASMMMGIVIQGIKYVIAPMVDMQSYLGILIQTTGSLLGGAIMYLALALYFHFSEAEMVGKFIKQSVSQVKKFFRRNS